MASTTDALSRLARTLNLNAARLQGQISDIARIVLISAASYRSANDIRAAATTEALRARTQLPSQFKTAIVPLVLKEVLRQAPTAVLRSLAFQELSRQI